MDFRYCGGVPVTCFYGSGTTSGSPAATATATATATKTPTATATATVTATATATPRPTATATALATSTLVDSVGEIATNVNLAIGRCDLVNDFQAILQNRLTMIGRIFVRRHEDFFA
jgi:hypothetical protein